ncbi:hypothetical protein V7x_49290 [Crateriforma conspicua]|uniref:Uncharacterized protein n=1 Tax=Crateriforma conspicua TaxID=2527996 RepID=A0A5C6FP50_9PLAN|nr:hypothetical protein V7x_49290 [Crateriforma conspicua]
MMSEHTQPTDPTIAFVVIALATIAGILTSSVL